MNRITLILSALLVWVIYFVIGFGSAGNDWGNPEFQAIIIRDAILNFKEFPYFSFFQNGGNYVVQDPQGHALSALSLPWILSFGPFLGFRFYVASWMSAGFLGYYSWCKDKVSKRAAYFSALAFVLCLNFFWRTIQGAEQMSAMMALPWLLLFIDRRNVYLFSILFAILVFGPGFQSLFYCVGPVCFFYFIVALKNSKDKKNLLIMGSITLVLLLGMIAFRLEPWLLLKMSRNPDLFDGTVSLRDAIYWLFNYARAGLGGVRIQLPHLSNANRWYEVWEVHMALSPVASLLAGVGGYHFLKRYKQLTSQQRTLGECALFLFIFGICIATMPGLFEWIKQRSFDGIRTPSRFLVLSALGLSLLINFSFKFVHQELFLIIGFVLFLLPIHWIYRAHERGVIQWPNQLPAPVTLPRPITEDRFCTVGASCLRSDDAGFNEEPYKQCRIKWADQLIKVKMTHTSLAIPELRAGEKLHLPLRLPALGFKNTEPNFKIESEGGCLKIQNQTDYLTHSTTLKVRPPYTYAGFVISLTSWIIVFLGLVFKYKRSIN